MSNSPHHVASETDRPVGEQPGPRRPKGLAVLTSGGDAPGMNAAVRAVVRTAVHHGLDTYAIYEGYRGMVDGGPAIQPFGSEDVGGILYQGGTVIGTARSEEFRARPGRRRAARNLVERGIDALVVIGGDGSLSGADLFRREWPGLLDDLVDAGSIDRATADAHAHLRVVGLVGSIDNDMFGTDMTIGADTALHRITEAVDAIHSTAAAHQRTFVIEVMGRNCGYLALMSSLAAGANWVLIPEHPPETDDWEDAMCAALKAGRAIGRRQNLVMVAEGARDRHGEPITVDYVREVLKTRMGEDTRVTILGHVQRGGSPSAFDRYLSTLLGHAAVEHLLTMPADGEPQVIGIRGNRVTNAPLMESVERTHGLADLIREGRYDEAMERRGGSFMESFRTFRTMVQAQPRTPPGDARRRRFAVLHAGGPAPGMNTAARIAVRLGIDRGHEMLAVQNGFAGLARGRVEDTDWMTVSGWVGRGGAELGTSRYVPSPGDLDAIAEQVERHRIDGLLMVGGWAGYEAAYALHSRRDEVPALDVPIVCLPASINNDLPGSELSVGSDTALNAIVEDVDKIKQSAVAVRRCFVVEVMGHDSGYLALMSGLATGSERVYLPEEGITLEGLREDVELLTEGFRGGKRLGLIIRGEHADAVYTTTFISALLEKEGGDLFDVRSSILGHVQQGGNPTPFDRIIATRLAAQAVAYLDEQAGHEEHGSAMVGLVEGRVRFTDLTEFPALREPGLHRPVHQHWRTLRPVATVMANPGH